jgi:hypothetical protein
VVGVHVTQLFSFPSGDPAELADLTPRSSVARAGAGECVGRGFSPRRAVWWPLWGSRGPVGAEQLIKMATGQPHRRQQQPRQGDTVARIKAHQYGSSRFRRGWLLRSSSLLVLLGIYLVSR